MSPTATLDAAPAVVEVTETAAPEVRLSAAEKDVVVQTAADTAAKATVRASGQTGTSRAWSAEADVD